MRGPWSVRKTPADGERAAVQGMREHGKSVLVGHCFVLCQVELTLPKGVGYSCLSLVLLKNEL